jgi:23S rRNA A2030 N6-methylase RlmJ
VILQPPWQLDRDLGQALPVLHDVLAPGGGGRTRVAILAGE